MQKCDCKETEAADSYTPVIEGDNLATMHLTAALELLKERGNEYGPAGHSMHRAAVICEAMWGLRLEARDIARVLFALKIAREDWRHKDDNVHDALAYLAIIGSLSEEK